MISFQTGFINPQLGTGPVATAYFQSVQADLGFAPSGVQSSKHYAILEYWYNLSVGTFFPATLGNSNSFGLLGSGELATIGYLVGFPWPSIYTADFSGSNFQFITNASFPGTNPQIGFSSAAPVITFGTFISAIPQQVGNYVSISVYQQILKFVAYIKWNGFSIIAIDYLLNAILKYLGYAIVNSYTIKYGPNNDIVINFNIATANIGPGWLYVLQLVFNRVCTIPTTTLSIS